jgi:hypothetical protein
MNFKTIIHVEDNYSSLNAAVIARPNHVKSCAQIIPACLAAFFLTAGLAVEAQGIISTFPASSGADSFYIGTDAPGNYEAGASAFTPQQDYTLTSATVELSGYDGSAGQLASLSIFSDLPEPYNPDMSHQPGGMLATGTVSPNDGSESGFTVDFSGELNLSANTIYWLLVQDSSPNGWQAPNGFYWMTGGNPTGEAAYNGSEAFIVSGFSPNNDPPAFSIDAISTDVPEPSEYKLMGAAGLAGLMISRWRRSICEPASLDKIIKPVS